MKIQKKTNALSRLFWEKIYHSFEVFISFMLGTCGVWASSSCSTGAYRTWAQELRGSGPLAVASRFSCLVACGISVPWPGIEPMSPTLEGRFYALPLDQQGSFQSFDQTNCYLFLKIYKIAHFKTCGNFYLSKLSIR